MNMSLQYTSCASCQHDSRARESKGMHAARVKTSERVGSLLRPTYVAAVQEVAALREGLALWVPRGRVLLDPKEESNAPMMMPGRTSSIKLSCGRLGRLESATDRLLVGAQHCKHPLI